MPVAVVVVPCPSEQEYLGFVQAIGDAIAGKRLRDCKAEDASGPVRKLLDLLARLDSWADEVEPVEQQQRFGNKAYRTWHARLEEVCPREGLRS